jgi:ABC-type transport system substrate-binding protein
MVPGINARRLMLNFQVEELRNKKVRQAIAYALDPSENVEKIYLGTAGVARGTVHDEYPYAIPSFYNAYWQYPREERLARAEQLLIDAGYPGGEGIEFTVSVCPNYGTIEDEKGDALIIQNQLAEIGITVHVEELDTSTWKSRKLAGTLDAHMDGFYPDFPDPSNCVSEMITSRWAHGGYPVLYDNPEMYPEFRFMEMMDLIDEGYELWDPDIPWDENPAREANYILQQEIMAEDVYVVPYFYQAGFLVHTNELVGFEPYWEHKNLWTPGLLASYILED